MAADSGQEPATALNISQSVLQYFWDLASYDEEVRLTAARGLVADVIADQAKHNASLGKDNDAAPEEGAPKQKQLEYHLRRCSPTMVYTLRRLARGLASSRQAARQGYATALAGLLAPSAKTHVTPAGVMVLLEVCVDGPVKGGDAKDTLLARLFGYGALLRSGLPLEAHMLAALFNGLLESFWSCVVEGGLMDSSHERRYLGFQLFARCLPHLRPEHVATVFSPALTRTLTNAVKRRDSYLHASARKLLDGIAGFLERSDVGGGVDGGVKMAVAAALQRLGGMAPKELAAGKLTQKLVQPAKAAKSKVAEVAAAGGSSPLAAQPLTPATRGVCASRLVTLLAHLSHTAQAAALKAPGVALAKELGEEGESALGLLAAIEAAALEKLAPLDAAGKGAEEEGAGKVAGAGRLRSLAALCAHLQLSLLADPEGTGPGSLPSAPLREAAEALWRGCCDGLRAEGLQDIVFAKKSPNSPLLLAALVPLVRALATAARPGGQPQVADRLKGVIVNKLSKCRCAADVDVLGGLEGYGGALKRLLYEASRNKDRVTAAAALAGYTALLRAGGAAEDTQVADAARASFRAALGDLLTSKKSRLQPDGLAALLSRVLRAPPEGLAAALTAGGATGLGGAFGAALAACAAGPSAHVPVPVPVLPMPAIRKAPTAHRMPLHTPGLTVTTTPWYHHVSTTVSVRRWAARAAAPKPCAAGLGGAAGCKNDEEAEDSRLAAIGRSGPQ
eukprot:XP_001689438.1 predicted protein [Chlamydomonas reinhardtii]